ncbi:MAG TPA: class I adenylate-forming enzyme family protein [Jatrophihabitans sp.]|nr:class I adenylate-forming enzyme family protein [Jatrophihabitans sp.]
MTGRQPVAGAAPAVEAARSPDAVPRQRQVRPAWPSVWQLLRERAASTPDLPYLDIGDRSGAWCRLSFGEFHARAAAVADRLRGEHGIGHRTRVALIARNDLESVQALFGVLATGAEVFLLSPNDPPERRARQLAARAPNLVLGEEAVALTVAAPAGPPAAAHCPAVDSDPALLFNTSGSTDLPKTVVQPHQAVLTNAVAFCRHHRLRPGERLLGFLPISHANAVHTNLMAPLVAGCHSILLPELAPFDLPRRIEELDPRLVSMVPSAVEALLAVWRKPRRPPSLTHVLTAAAPLAASAAARFTALTSVPVVQGYGLTETTNFSTSLPLDLPAGAYRRLMTEAGTPTVGAAFPGTEVSVVGPDGTPLPPGATGEICMRGPSLMTGYLDDPAATAAAFAGGRFHSGDLGQAVLDPDAGTVFVLTGRLKNIAKVRGEQVSLEEVEHGLTSVGGIRDAGCARTEHPLDGEQIVAAVVLDDLPAAAALTAAAVRDRLRATLPAVAVPRLLVRVPGIPRTPTGKIVRPALRQLIEDHRRRGDQL